MAMDFIGLSVGMGYTDETMLGAGAIKGEKGDKGDSGNTYTPAIGTIRTVDNLTEANATVDINNNTLKATFNFDIPQGRTGSQGEQGIQGEKGEKGDTYAPVIGDVLTVDSTSEASVTIEVDADTARAIYNFDIPKGKDGTNGVDGTNGIDGVSPTVEVIPTDTGNTVKITDKDGVKSFDVNNGTNGADGTNGTDGINGNDGADGFSPVVTVTDIEGGHNVAIEDANGVKNFEVLDGKGIITSLEELGLTAPTTVGEVFMAMPNKSMAILSCEAKDEADGTITVSDIPVSYGVLIIKKNGVGRFSIEYQNSSYSTSSNVKKWIGTLKGADGTGLKWKELATTDNAIENVPPTNIAFNTDYVTKNDISISMYEIRNGICYVTMDVTSVVSADAGRVVCTLPKPSSQMQFTIPPYSSQSTIRVGAILFANGNLSFFSLEAGKRYMHTFSYPVAQ